MRIVAFWISVVLLFLLGLSGLQSFLGDWSLATTLGQRISTVGQGVFGACGVLAGTGAVLKRKWGEVAALAFAVSAGITAGLASMAWGGSGLGAGFASGCLGFLIGILLYWGISPRRNQSFS
jgi:hypothetical protein